MPIFVPCYGNIYNLPDDGSSDDKNHFRPESSVFSLFMNGSSFLSGLCTYFRFRQVQHYQTKSTNINHIWKLNVVSLLFSIISSIGLLIVANFQEAKRWVIVATSVPINTTGTGNRLFTGHFLYEMCLKWVMTVAADWALWMCLIFDYLIFFYLVIILKCLTQPSRTSVRTPGILSNIKRRIRPETLRFRDIPITQKTSVSRDPL